MPAKRASMLSETFEAKHWRKRAEEVRAIANQMEDGVARRTMLRLVFEYEKMAMRPEKLAEERLESPKGA